MSSPQTPRYNPHMRAYLLWKVLLFRPVLALLWRPRIIGRDRVPRTGGVLVVSNHLAAADTVLIPGFLPRQMSFPAKKELFQKPGITGRILSVFLRSNGIVSMDRDGGQASADSLSEAYDVLHAGGALGFFPEGTRSPDGRLYKARTGVVRAVLDCHVPVVPAAVQRTTLKKGPFGIPLPQRATITYGEPLDFSRYWGTRPTRDVLRWIADECFAAVQELSGQTYVDVYASSVKAGHYDGREAELQARVRPRPGGGPAPEPGPPVEK